MPQTRVSYSSPIGLEGQIASATYNVIRGTLQELLNGMNTNLPFGRAVVTGDDPRKLVLPSATGQQFRGITVINDSWGIDEMSYLAGENIGFPVGTPVDVLTWGDIHVWVETAVNIGDMATFRHTAEADPLDVLGRFSNAPSANHDAVPNGRFVTGTTGAGIAVLNLGGF